MHVAAIVVMEDTVATAACSMRGAASRRRRAVAVLQALVALTAVAVQVRPPLSVVLTSVMMEASTGTPADAAASLRSE